MTTTTIEVRPEETEQYRRELTGYCYRMLGSAFEADDAVQETMVRAWRKAEGFEGRSGVRSWLYRIATNVCLDMLRSRQRRARPIDLGPASAVDSFTPDVRPEYEWVGPMPDGRVLSATADPAELATAKESIRLAFVAALQHLPARQRAVLILREVLAWQASEVAELLDTSVASVNSALQRARATLAARDLATDSTVVGAEQEALLARYVTAFESYDVAGLVSLLHEEAVLSMPPFRLWISGRAELARWFDGPGSGCRGSRLLPVAGNGLRGFGSYRPNPAGGHAPWGIQLLEFRDGLIAAQHSFIDPALFPEFGLPTHLAPGEVWLPPGNWRAGARPGDAGGCAPSPAGPSDSTSGIHRTVAPRPIERHRVGVGTNRGANVGLDRYTELADEVAANPDLVERLLAEHVQGDEGWCRAHDARPERHPCSIRRLAQLAEDRTPTR